MAMKQMETTKVTVGECDFYIKPFPAFKAANLTGELASTLTPLFGAIAPLVGEGENLMDTDAGMVAGAISNCSGISGDKLELLMQKLLLGGHIAVEYTKENGNKEIEQLNMDIANEVFCGEVQDMFVLCVHVIKLNFNGFFKKFAGLFGKVKSELEQKTARTII